MDSQDEEKKFVPVGAIAFFVTLLLFYGVVWVSFYVLTVRRG